MGAFNHLSTRSLASRAHLDKIFFDILWERVIKCLLVADYTVFSVRWNTYFLVNRVENQNEPKRPQSGGRLGSFWFSTRPTAMGGTDYNLHLVSEAL